MSFIHVNNHLHAKTLFVACCKMSNKHLIAGYHHDKQITSRVWISHLFACVRPGRWWWPRYETFGSLQLECESELKGGEVGRFNLKSKLWKLFYHTKFIHETGRFWPAKRIFKVWTIKAESLWVQSIASSLL